MLRPLLHVQHNACSLVSSQSADVVFHSEIGVYNSAVPVSPRTIAEDLMDLVHRHSLTIRSIAAHCVIGIGDRHDTCDFGNVLGSQASRIAARRIRAS